MVSSSVQCSLVMGEKDTFDSDPFHSDPFGHDSKELLAISSIAGDINSSIHALLLAGSPRHTTASPNTTLPATPGYTKAQATVLSPWKNCISQNMESPQACATPPPFPSPEMGPTITVCQGSGMKFPLHCSPPRNRFHSPPRCATDGCCISCDLKVIPDLEGDVGRGATVDVWRTGDVGRLSPTSPLPCSAFEARVVPSSVKGPLGFEARVEMEPEGRSSIQSVGATNKDFFVTITDRSYYAANSAQPFAYTSSKPPRPPRLGRKYSGKFDCGTETWRLYGGALQRLGHLRWFQGVGQMVENVMISMVSLMLLVLLLVVLSTGHA